MKVIKCEMCSSSDVIKDGEFYVCQSCGTKYTEEAAKKLMVEGTVKIDLSDKVKNWYELARRARDSKDSKTAKKYYDMILEENPNDWEADFYSTYFGSLTITNGEISQTIRRMTAKVRSSAMPMLTDDKLQGTEKDQAVMEMTVSVLNISDFLLAAEKNYAQQLAQAKTDYLNNHVNTLLALADLPWSLGDILDQQNEDYELECFKLFTKGIEILESDLAYPSLTAKIKIYADKVRKYQPDYKAKRENGKSGCYVATCVYGSYDCPQVWTLRRYRDDTLASTWHGRAFIRTYYAVSPTLVKWFGHTKWFKKMWQGKLDRMVKNLNGKGVEDTPYQDKQW